MAKQSTSDQLDPMFGYIRVSKVGLRSADELISPELQQHSIQAWADANRKRIVRWFTDLDETGRNFERRRVGEMIDGITRGEANGVALWKWSRWGRNLLQSRMYIALVEDAGGEVRAATEDFDTKTTMGKFTRDQMLMIAEFQSNQISDGWKETQDRRRRNGLPHGGGKRFGYTYAKGEGYSIDPATAEYVEFAYQKYVTGSSMVNVARELNALGVATSTGGRWTGQTIGIALDQGFAAGWIRERSNPEGKARRHAIDSFDSWRLGAHEPIIPQDLWEAYRSMRTDGNRKPHTKSKYALSGMLTCAECGANLTARVGGADNRRMWVCGKRQRDKNLGLDTHRPVSVDQWRVSEAIEVWLAQMIEGGEDLHERLRTAATNARSERPASNVQSLTDQLAALARQRTNLSRDLMKERITEDDFDTLVAEVDAEAEEIQGALARERVLPQPHKVRPAKGQFIEWQSVFNEATRLDQAAILRQMFAGIVVQAGRFSDRKVRVVPSWI